MIPEFKEHKPTGEAVTPFDLEVMQQQIRTVTDEIAGERRPQLSAEFIEKNAGNNQGISLTAGIENLVAHGLDRKIRGWYLADIQGPAIVWRVAASDADLSKHLPLACSASVTVRLVVW